MTIELPFPPSALNPNKRQHWAVKARAFKAYKSQCFAILSQHRERLHGVTAFSIEFRPPDARRRDADNCMAACKATWDALSHVTGIDDSKFRFSISMGRPLKGGAVLVS